MVDLIILQFAGIVGKDTKRYLKEGGILLCNNSHGNSSGYQRGLFYMISHHRYTQAYVESKNSRNWFVNGFSTFESKKNYENRAQRSNGVKMKLIYRLK